MESFKEIIETIFSMAPMEYERSLIELIQEPFSTQCEIVLLLRDRIARLRLDGVHFQSTRQSMLGRVPYQPPSFNSREDWFINYFNISTDSGFLKAFLNKQLGFESDICLYDTLGVRLDESKAKMPIHVNIVCGGGILDIICESVSLDMG